MHKSLTQRTFASPVPQAARWIKDVTFPADRPLINVSQAAPVDPPALGMRHAMAAALEDPATHRYTPDLGMPPLRAKLAMHWGGLYGGAVSADQVAITSGCNQAFCAAISALCDHGDEVILPVPWYFNHKMWLDMVGVTAVPLTTGANLLPDPDVARSLITSRTRAIVLVSPNNPAGVEYPPALIRALFDVAQAAGVKLIIDETYRDFHSAPDTAPHELLTLPNWEDTLIQLYSFSKSFRMTGHRVGAMIGNAGLMPEVEKFIDTVTICATGLGQTAALWGLENLGQWVRDEADQIAVRRAALSKTLTNLAPLGWRLKGVGAYFAYVEHPFAADADQVARDLVTKASILALPGTMFMPMDDASGARHLRLACANIDVLQIKELGNRLAGLSWPLATPRAAD